MADKAGLDQPLQCQPGMQRPAERPAGNAGNKKTCPIRPVGLADEGRLMGDSRLRFRNG